MGFGTGIYLFPELGTGVVAWCTAGPPRQTVRFLQDELLSDAPQMAAAQDNVRNPAQSGRSIESDSASVGNVGMEVGSELAGIPYHDRGWAGEYRNGDEKLELRRSNGSLTFFTGTGELGIEPGSEGRMTVVLDDGRQTDITFRLVIDGRGRRYLIRGTDTNPKAFLNEEDRNW
jgi:hypothetical protein